MNKRTLGALIVTGSIPLADGLDALLRAFPQIDEVRIARNPDNAFQHIEYTKPRLVLIDAALTGKRPEAILEKITSLSPETQRILLVDDVEDVRWMPQHAEAVLIKGVSPSAIAAIVTDLLFLKGDGHDQNDPDA